MPEKKHVKAILLGHDHQAMDSEDMLVHIHDLQREFAKKWFPLFLKMNSQNPIVDKSGEFSHPLTAKAVASMLQKNLACISNEVEEIREWLPWKHWKNYEGFEVDLDELRFEYIDLLHFVMEGMILLGMDAFEIHRYYVSKMEENLRRQREEYSRAAF